MEQITTLIPLIILWATLYVGFNASIRYFND